jgi:DNA-binding response OmpR family regulator
VNEVEETSGRILLVDDDQEIAEIVIRFLQGEGYDVQHAASGQAGLDIIEKDIPDLLLLDVSLPDVNGFEICRRLRSSSHTEHLNILMLTGRGSVDAKVTGLEAGADDYLIKPFDAQELLARVQAQLRLKFLRDRLVEMEKIATIGQMVITLSHEINNPLTAIVWQAELEAHRIQQVMTKLANVTRPVIKEYLPGTPMIDLEGSDSTTNESNPNDQ